jgi:hypothetical protein
MLIKIQGSTGVVYSPFYLYTNLGFPLHLAISTIPVIVANSSLLYYALSCIFLYSFSQMINKNSFVSDSNLHRFFLTKRSMFVFKQELNQTTFDFLMIFFFSAESLWQIFKEKVYDLSDQQI